MSEVAKKRFKEFELFAFALPHKNEWTIEAYTGNWRKAGVASFVGVYEFLDEDDPRWTSPTSSVLVGLKGWDVEVSPDHRRKGLASEMYAFAEEAFELPVSAGDFQTEAGTGFLKRRTKR